MFHVASGFMDYMDGICATSATIFMLIAFAAIVFRQTTLFKSIGSIKKLIDDGEPFLNKRFEYKFH